MLKGETTKKNYEVDDKRLIRYHLDLDSSSLSPRNENRDGNKIPLAIFISVSLHKFVILILNQNEFVGIMSIPGEMYLHRLL